MGTSSAGIKLKIIIKMYILYYDITKLSNRIYHNIILFIAHLRGCSSWVMTGHFFHSYLYVKLAFSSRPRKYMSPNRIYMSPNRYVTSPSPPHVHCSGLLHPQLIILVYQNIRSESNVVITHTITSTSNSLTFYILVNNSLAFQVIQSFKNMKTCQCNYYRIYTVCMYVRTYVCMYVFMYVSVYVCICMYVYMYVCTYVCMYMCMYVCIYVYCYIYVCTYV